MKVSDYLPLYGLLFNFDNMLNIEARQLSVNDLFEKYPDIELSDINIDFLLSFDRASLTTVLKDDYFTTETVIPYLRGLFDEYRECGGNPLYWLEQTHEYVNLNPDNFRSELITTIERALIDWIDIFTKQPFDYLYHVTNPQLVPGSETKTNKYFTKHHVLAYIFECYAKGVQPPNGNKKELEKIGSKRMGEGKKNTFYKIFNDISINDLNSESVLIKICGENWRDAVIELSQDPELVEKYLINKQL